MPATDRQVSSRCGRGAECLAKVRTGQTSFIRLADCFKDCDGPVYLLIYQVGGAAVDDRSEALNEVEVHR